MSRSLLPFLTLLALVCLPPTADAQRRRGRARQPSQRVISSDEGFFRITLPRSFPAPRSETLQIPTPLGPMKLMLQRSSVSDETALVGWGVAPTDSLDESPDAGVLIDSTLQQLLAPSGAGVERSYITWLDGAPGRLLFVAGRDGRSRLYGRYEIYVAGPFVHVIGFTSPTRVALRERDIESYFRSFTSTMPLMSSFGVTLEPANAGFSARLPRGYGEAVETSRPVEGGEEALKMSTAVAHGPLGTLSVAWVDYPVQLIASIDPEALVDSAARHVVERLDGRIIRQQAIALRGRLGRAVTYDGSFDGRPIHGRMELYLSDDRLFQISQLSQDPAALEQGEAEEFFRSFTFEEQKR